MRLKNINVQVGGFHDHWLRNGTDTPAVLIAALAKYHYDFICLMDAEFPEKSKDIKKQTEMWMPGMKVYLGAELMYGWGHVVSVMNGCTDVDLQNTDFKSEFLKLKRSGGIVALAHIGHELSLEKIVKTGKVGELIDEGLVDAVQIENESDWENIKERAESGKKLPLISGWDSHMLLNVPGMPDCIYNENYGVKEHFEHSSYMRTVVFAEDNSLESIKKALEEGKSVLEDIETGKIYGSPKLVKLLEDNEYKERMAELDREYNSFNIKSGTLLAHGKKRIKFPCAGKVTYAIDSYLNKKTADTDENGYFCYENIPMPSQKDESYLPIMFSSGKTAHYRAIKVENDIKLEMCVKLIEGKRVLSVYTREEFDGKLVFKKPYGGEYTVSAEKNSVLFQMPLDGNIGQIFEYDFTAVKDAGIKREYASRLAFIAAHKYNGSWEAADELILDSSRYCGGFGSFRPYPGKDVFSLKIKILWDEDYLYLRYDITDKKYVVPPKGRFMYLSDCTAFSIDPLFKRTHTRDSGCEMIIGFPDERGEIICTHTPVYENGEGYFNRSDNCVLNGDLNMEKTENGRIVTVKIPWHEISPEKVEAGSYMGILAGALNDEGNGLVDNMQWPWPAEKGEWLFPDNWGIMILAD